MLPDRVLNPGPLTCESGALPIALERERDRERETNTDFYEMRSLKTEFQITYRCHIPEQDLSI